MLPENVRNLWYKLYLLSGIRFTIADVNQYINQNPNGGHLGYPNSKMMYEGYIRSLDPNSLYFFEFTDKFIEEIKNV